MDKDTIDWKQYSNFIRKKPLGRPLFLFSRRVFFRALQEFGYGNLNRLSHLLFT
jgi:hypothetical protein